MTGPLHGIRVLDLSRVLAGPYCTQMLGDLGADIIKIERPFIGDDTRRWGPPFLKDKNGQDMEESAYYLSVNRNKKSVAIDIAKPEGQLLIHKLLGNTDILVENFRTGDLAQYGLSYTDLKDKYKSLIYCSITGFGQNGAMAREPGYDLMAQAMGGLMGATGEKDGAPMKAGVAMSDILTGLHAATAILAALHARKTKGSGQHIDVALMDCTLASMTNLAQYYLTSGHAAPRQGNAHSTIVPYQAFAAQDGYFVIAVGNDTQFERFCDVMRQPDWASDSRFATNRARVENRAILVPLMEAIVTKNTVAHWVEACRLHAIPAGPVNSMDAVFAQEQVRQREMLVNIDDIPLIGSPLKLSQTAVTYNLPPPSCGQHTREVLEKDLQLGADEIAALQAGKIIETR